LSTQSSPSQVWSVLQPLLHLVRQMLSVLLHTSGEVQGLVVLQTDSDDV
jgi:hypothetical protein